MSALPASDLAHAPVEVRRSKRRKRTVQAYLRDDTVVVLLPARMTKAEEKYWVAVMVERLQRQEQRRRRRADAGDADLFARAQELSARYLDGQARPAEVRWVDNQNDRWGSCTPANGSIRLSSRLRELPQWVADYVLLHELAHLLEPGHGPAFWRLLDRYPKTERARGYLEGVLAAPGFAAGTPPADPAAGGAEPPPPAGPAPDCDEPPHTPTPDPDDAPTPRAEQPSPPADPARVELPGSGGEEAAGPDCEAAPVPGGEEARQVAAPARVELPAPAGEKPPQVAGPDRVGLPVPGGEEPPRLPTGAGRDREGAPWSAVGADREAPAGPGRAAAQPTAGTGQEESRRAPGQDVLW